MPVSIRTGDGELSFRDLDEVRQAVTTGLVDPTDEIRASETEPWRPVAEVVGRVPRRRWKDHYHWYVLTAVLVGLALLRVGILWFLLVVGSHALWLATMRRGTRRPPRWW